MVRMNSGATETGLVRCRLLKGALSAAIFAALLGAPASAETISNALARAYGYNPDLNQQRASARATDENMPNALSGYRPTVTATSDIGRAWQEQHAGAAAKTPGNTRAATSPRGAGVTVTQNLWNGNRTINGVDRAEA